MFSARRRFLALLVASPVWAAKKRKQKAEDLLGLAAGTVFHPGGRSLPGAKVVLADPADADFKMETVSDGRGEFVFRAPASADGKQYKVRAEAKGLKPAEKSIIVYEAQKSNVNLILGEP